MSNYYFLGTFLPELTVDAKPEITFAELDVLYRDNLSPRDYEKVLAVRSIYDILNIRSFWLEEEIDPRGDLDPLGLGEALFTRSGLPDFVYEFMDRYPKKEDRIHHFPFLLATSFRQSAGVKDPFLRHYMNFERELRLVMTAFRAKKLGRDLSVELQYEDPEEDLIAQLLAQKDAKSYEPPEKYRELKTIFEKYGDLPMALQKAIDEYRLKMIDQLVDMADVFSIERMLAYFCQFLIVEKWHEIDREKGVQMIQKIVRENGNGTNS